MVRIRHCVECPKCFTRYLISFSPYRNGSYLIPTMTGSAEEYALYCSCRRTPAASRWRWSEVMVCEVSRAAYERGFGSREEVLEVKFEERPFFVSRQSDWKAIDRRKSSV